MAAAELLLTMRDTGGRGATYGNSWWRLVNGNVTKKNPSDDVQEEKRRETEL